MCSTDTAIDHNLAILDQIPVFDKHIHISFRAIFSLPDPITQSKLNITTAYNLCVHDGKKSDVAPTHIFIKRLMCFF